MLTFRFNHRITDAIPRLGTPASFTDDAIGNVVSVTDRDEVIDLVYTPHSQPTQVPVGVLVLAAGMIRLGVVRRRRTMHADRSRKARRAHSAVPRS